MRRTIPISLGTFVLLVVGGCGTGSTPTTEEAANQTAGDLMHQTQRAVTPPVVKVATVAQSTTAAVDDTSEAAATDGSQGEIPVVAERFDPPFPERTDLFAPPERPDLSAARNNGVASSPLELKGFVNVDGPRAVLLIEGHIATLAAGDEQDGVQVVSISPPQITLQRGRDRWTLSLFQPR